MWMSCLTIVIRGTLIGSILLFVYALFDDHACISRMTYMSNGDVVSAFRDKLFRYLDTNQKLRAHPHYQDIRKAAELALDRQQQCAETYGFEQCRREQAKHGLSCLRRLGEKQCYAPGGALYPMYGWFYANSVSLLLFSVRTDYASLRAASDYPGCNLRSGWPEGKPSIYPFKTPWREGLPSEPLKQ